MKEGFVFFKKKILLLVTLNPAGDSGTEEVGKIGLGDKKNGQSIQFLPNTEALIRHGTGSPARSKRVGH